MIVNTNEVKKKIGQMIKEKYFRGSLLCK